MIRIGTCSWKYDSWKGIVYADEKVPNMLKEYAKHFSTVEIDQWFWSLFENNRYTMPKNKDVEEYNASVPDDFRFTIKLPNSISLTHYYLKSKSVPLKENPYFLSVDLYNEFLEAIAPMASKVGVVMLQFEYLNKQKMHSLNQFLDKLEAFVNAIPKTIKLGIETRNPNYLKKEYFEFLFQHKLVPVFLHGYYMPPVFETYKSFKELIDDTVVLRLHGPDRSGIEAVTGNIWNAIVQPKDDEIEKIIEMMRSLLERETDLYVNVNNHYEGSAPLTIKKIQSHLYA